MAEQKKGTDWQTMVRCYKSQAGDPWKEISTTIPEPDFCIKLPNIEEGPIGRPIDANLAVNLMADLYKAIDIAYGKENDADVEKLTEKEVRDAYNTARAFLKLLVGLDYGMTIDKNFALKVLSQPKCEGLRGYLCLKKSVEAPFSLVTVGVDKDGYDLKYNLEKTVSYAADDQDTNVVVDGVGLTPPVKNVQMRSLNGEYVTPPYTIEGKTPEFLSRFVLLNIATGRKDLLQMSKSI